MTTAWYLDTSVMLRFVLRQPDWLDLHTLEVLTATSALARLECMRTLDRLRLTEGENADEDQRLADTLGELLDGTQELELNQPVMLRAALPLPMPLGALDAIHLASALMWRETHHLPTAFATHDRALARAAQRYGFRVFGVLDL